MRQLTLFADEQHNQIVNVASVPQRSPFRYPGGKTWLAPRIRQWLSSLPTRPATFIEPFAGGGSVGLAVAFEKLAEHTILIELDTQVAAVWETILSDDGQWLAQQMSAFHLTLASVKTLLSRTDLSRREQAFRTLVKNRVNRGGILAPGAGLLKEGENGKGLLSRWYPDTLSKRILDICAIQDRLTFIEGDGLTFLEQHAQDDNAVFFIDPPYTAGSKKAGSRLYTHSMLNHEHLFAVADKLRGDFLMTYDDDEQVRALARTHGFEMQAVAMKNTHHAKMTELLIGRNLEWLRVCLSSIYPDRSDL